MRVLRYIPSDPPTPSRVQSPEPATDAILSSLDQEPEPNGQSRPKLDSSHQLAKALVTQNDSLLRYAGTDLHTYLGHLLQSAR